MLEDGRDLVSPVAAVAPVLRDVGYGYIVGTLVGIVVERRARRRRPAEQAAGIRDSLALLGASFGFVVGLLSEIS